MKPLVDGNLHFEATADKALEALDTAKAVLRNLSLFGAKYSVRIELVAEVVDAPKPEPSIVIATDAPKRWTAEVPPERPIVIAKVLPTWPVEIPPANHAMGNGTTPLTDLHETPFANLRGAGRTDELLPNPTPAAPETRDEPPAFDYIPALNDGTLRFRNLPRAQRLELVSMLGRGASDRLGHPLSMNDWDSNKPTWMPTASGLLKTSGWPGIWAEWQALFATTEGTPSGESA